jgi:hypothetical protein
MEGVDPEKGIIDTVPHAAQIDIIIPARLAVLRDASGRAHIQGTERGIVESLCAHDIGHTQSGMIDAPVLMLRHAANPSGRWRSTPENALLSVPRLDDRCQPASAAMVAPLNRSPVEGSNLHSIRAKTSRN